MKFVTAAIFLLMQIACVIVVAPRGLPSSSRLPSDDGEGITSGLNRIETKAPSSLDAVATSTMSVFESSAMPEVELKPGVILAGSSMNLTLEKLFENNDVVRNICWSVDSSSLLVELENEDISIWEVESGNQWPPVIARGGSWSPNGSYLALYSEGEVNLTALKNEVGSTSFRVDGRIVSVDWAGDSQAVYVAIQNPARVDVLGVQGRGKQAEISADRWERLQQIDVSTDGDLLAVMADGLYVVSLTSGRVEYENPGAQLFAWSPDGKRAALWLDAQVLILDTGGWGILQAIPVAESGTGAMAMGWSPNGEVIALSQGTQVWLLAVETGSELHRTAGYPGGVRALAFSPDGKYLAIGAADRLVSLWKIDYLR
ncbi:MAG: WD40 repeat domain-containing protein [Anaerolineae bacterium]|nr:WD40 repeat domain-containing protein [Anaerolineae bacterium]